MTRVFPLAARPLKPFVPFELANKSQISFCVTKILTGVRAEQFDIVSIRFGDQELLARGSMPASMLREASSLPAFRLMLRAGVPVRIVACWRGWPRERQWWKRWWKALSKLWRGPELPPLLLMSLVGHDQRFFGNDEA